MSAAEVADGMCSSTLREPEAGWLEGELGPMFTFFHAPVGSPRAQAVLLCEALGPDRMNLHLTYRALAQALSAAGFAVLRFDPYGTADSSGSPRDPCWSEVLVRDAQRAADHLLARSGAARLAAFGARFGGTLAASLAAVDARVDALILLGPYVDGRAFLRGERMLHRLISSNLAPRQPSMAQPGDVEYLGFVYTAAAQTAIRALRPLEGTTFGCARANVIAWDEESSEAEFAEVLARHGASVDFDRPGDFPCDEILMFQRVPEAMISAWVDWLIAGEAMSATNGTGGHPLPGTAGRASAGALPARAYVVRSQREPRAIDEEAVRFGADGALFGIVSKAASASASSPTSTASGFGASGPGLILVNGGNNQRAGINRNYTEWARSAALGGTTTLRFDIRGLGDSPPRRAADRNQLYRDETREDVLAAIDLLSAREDCDGVVLCGLCAGAYQAFHAARRDPRVVGLVLLDLLRWDAASPIVPRKGFWDRRRREGTRILRRLLPMGLGGPLQGRTELARGLLELLAREVEILMVSCREGEGYALVSEALESDRETFDASERFELEVAADTDHIFTPIWAQEWVGQQIEAYLQRFARGR